MLDREEGWRTDSRVRRFYLEHWLPGLRLLSCCKPSSSEALGKQAETGCWLRVGFFKGKLLYFYDRKKRKVFKWLYFCFLFLF